MEQVEKWKRIDGFPYEVSNLGRIRRYKNISKFSNSSVGKILKPWKSGNYLAVTLLIDGKQHAFTVHRIVMETFIGERPYKADIHHIDGNKHNNRLENLGYTSRSHNMKALGYYPGPKPKLSKKEVELIKFLSKGIPGKTLAKQFRCSPATISNVINNNY